MPIQSETGKLEWDIYQTVRNSKNKGGRHFAPYNSHTTFNIALAYYFDGVVVLDACRPPKIPPLRNICRRILSDFPYSIFRLGILIGTLQIDTDGILGFP